MAPNNNQFNARSDQAALNLKAAMKDARTGAQIQPRPVPVDSDGQPARPLPPAGSYARMAIEQQRREAAANRPGLQDPVQANAEMQVQPQQAPTVVQSEQPSEVDQLSPNAQRRFSEFSTLLRSKDQELQQIKAQAQQLQESSKQTQQKLAEMEQRYNTLIQQNLESLDPESRQQVLSDVRLTEALQAMETRLMARVSPVLQTMQDRSTQEDLHRISQKYDGFSYEVHVPLIQMFREKNPHCSVEQAFRAIAEPEELQGGRQDRAAAIPPIATPQNGNAAPRYVPVEPKQTPEQELEMDRQRAFQLARSDKPEDKKIAGRAMDELLRKKLGNRLPGQSSQRRG
jgi:hypothetical protein